MKKQIISKDRLALCIILLLGFFLRIYGLNWDKGTHLHPDERFLTMVGTKISWPQNLVDYFNTGSSSLNPYNNSFDFFVYGTFPIFLNKVVAGLFNMDNYTMFNITGRILSCIFDTSIIFLLFKLSKKLWPSLIYSLMVLPIQLSHFFTTDTFLNLFLFLSFCLIWKKKYSLAGVVFGLALSSKVSAIVFFPFLLLSFVNSYLEDKKKSFFNLASFLFLTLCSFRFFSPYSFDGLLKINGDFIHSLKTLKNFDRQDAWYPPAVQWIKTKPLIFPLMNMFCWGLGIPLGLLILVSPGGFLLKFKKQVGGEKKIKILNPLSVSFVWIFFLFVFQGVQFVKTMRYFLPVYPFLALVAGDFTEDWLSTKSKGLKFIIIFSLFIYPISFVSIYSHPHSRIAASEWIYENIPKGSTLSCEHWDDCLPLFINGETPNFYKTEVLKLYDRDSETKWQEIDEQLEKVDYLIISSNRLWGSITKVPERYPQTSDFYDKLLNNKLSFKKVKEFKEYPTFLGIKIKDNWADEAFTVYDHPQVLIFKKSD